MKQAHVGNKFFIQVDTVDSEDLEDEEEVGIRAVEELLTDFLQLCHGTIRRALVMVSSFNRSVSFVSLLSFSPFH